MRKSIVSIVSMVALLVSTALFSGGCTLDTTPVESTLGPLGASVSPASLPEVDTYLLRCYPPQGGVHSRMYEGAYVYCRGEVLPYELEVPGDADGSCTLFLTEGHMDVQDWCSVTRTQAAGCK